MVDAAESASSQACSVATSRCERRKHTSEGAHTQKAGAEIAAGWCCGEPDGRENSNNLQNGHPAEVCPGCRGKEESRASSREACGARQHAVSRRIEGGGAEQPAAQDSGGWGLPWPGVAVALAGMAHRSPGRSRLQGP